MKSIRTLSLFKLLLLAIAAMGTAEIPAHAQNTTGSFTLAHKVLWAGAVLPPGELYVLGGFSGLAVASHCSSGWRLDGGDPVAASYVRRQSCEGQHLVLHEEGGESVVSALRLKPMGVALQFASPKLAQPVGGNGRIGSDRRLSTRKVEMMRKRPPNLALRFPLFSK